MADVFSEEVIDLSRVLAGGLRRCGFCQGSYSVELEVACSGCERTLCPFCATRAGPSYRCPTCRSGFEALEVFAGSR